MFLLRPGGSEGYGPRCGCSLAAGYQRGQLERLHLPPRSAGRPRTHSRKTQDIIDVHFLHDFRYRLCKTIGLEKGDQ